ncbi:MAG: hypothetical protein AB1505_06085 [Candidatus Latescibacterota bacterium]
MDLLPHTPRSVALPPRLIYYNDAHHFHAKRIDPPASRHLLHWPVDELLGTGVDVLVLGLGYGDVYFHDSRVGRVVGQGQQVWDSFIDWRILRVVETARALGTDPLREVIARGRQMGLPVFPSLKLQDSSPPGSPRCGRLKGERGATVCIGEEGRARWCYDFACEEVRQDKLAMAAEVLGDYQADGLELDFAFDAPYFRKQEAALHMSLMSRFVAQVRALADEEGRRQGRRIPLMARLSADREADLALGLDVEAWLGEGSVDWVVGQDDRILLDTGVQEPWLAEAARDAGRSAYYRPPRRIYDERVGLPSVEMYRALAQTLRLQGYAGMYLGYLPWPLAEREYQILREAAYPEAHARRDKRYLLQPREGPPDGPTTTPHRRLPAALEEGRTLALSLHLADDVDSARRDGEMRRPVLTLRFASFCVEDDLAIRCNGRDLPRQDAEVTDERALRMPIDLPAGMQLQAPLGMAAHWLRYELPPELLRRGANGLEIEVRRLAPRAGFARSLSGMEVQTRYRDFVRPQGLGVERIAPRGG